MVDSVSGGVRPLGDEQHIVKPGEIQTPDSVSKGYEQGNTVSYQGQDDKSQVLLDEHDGKPVLASPSPDAGHKAAQVTGSSSSPNIRLNASTVQTELAKGHQTLQDQHPEIAGNPDFAQRLQNIQEKLHTLTDISPSQLQGIRQDSQQLRTLASQPSLQPDELDTILSQIEAKLGDQSARYNQTKLEIDAQDRIQQSESNIEKTREHIEEMKQAKEKNPILFALKILASIFFPVLGLYEGVNAAVRQHTGKDHGMSLFSSPEANQQAVNNLRSTFGWKGPEATDKSEKVDKPDSEVKSDQPVNNDGEVDFTSEGPSLAEDGLRQSDFLKMLMKAQADEESKEKLQQAINALQSGDPKAAAEILDTISDSVSFDTESGDGAITDDFRGMIDHYLAEPEPGDVSSDYSKMTDEFLDVTEDTQKQVETAVLQESLIAQKTAV